ncbi:N-glycosylation protein-domain-containing protein [Corynascus similis CBS 632.67]
MYNRARPTAHQPRSDNRHSSTHTPKRSPSESRARGPAAATAPAALAVKAAAHDHAAAHTVSASHHHHHHHHHPGTGGGTAPVISHATVGPDQAGAGPVRSTLLQPRVAVALGVSKKWYPVLFLCRLASIAPGVLFGLPNALRLLATLHLMYLDRVLDGGTLSKLGRAGAASGGGGGGGVSSLSSSSGYDPAFEARLRLTEALLATIWCCASGYLSFFFTDCLMSRWLLHYTPQATIVRLLTVDAINGYLTSWVLHLTGGFEDPRLILPAWIVISTTLTVIYHITQRKINIRKETSMSISVFSIASFVSMVALLVQLHSNRSDYPDIPLLNFVRRVFEEAGRLAMRIMEYGDITREL